MHVALTEILQCPSCGGGLVLLATDTRGGRAVQGSLGCPGCSRTYAVADGVADLRDGGGGATPSLPGASDSAARGTEGVSAEEALRLAALLGLDAGADIEIIAAAADRRNARAAADSVSPLLTGARLPLADGRTAALATAAAAHVPTGEAVRVVAPGGRIVMTGADDGVAAGLVAAGCEIIASEGGVIVARRTGASAPPKLYQLG
jgi:uncharacterized protein YbaR (Trm112 family)